MDIDLTKHEQAEIYAMCSIALRTQNILNCEKELLQKIQMKMVLDR